MTVRPILLSATALGAITGGAVAVATDPASGFLPWIVVGGAIVGAATGVLALAAGLLVWTASARTTAAFRVILPSVAATVVGAATVAACLGVVQSPVLVQLTVISAAIVAILSTTAAATLGRKHCAPTRP